MKLIPAQKHEVPPTLPSTPVGLDPFLLQFFMEEAYVFEGLSPSSDSPDPCCWRAASLITELGFPNRTEGHMAPDWLPPFISHSSISSQPVIPWSRGRGKKRGPNFFLRKSIVVIQKTEKN